MKSCKSIVELATMFQNKVSILRQTIELRSLQDDGTAANIMKKVDTGVGEITVLLTVMKAHLKRRREALASVQQLKLSVENMQQQVDHATGNIPERRPNAAMLPPANIPKACTAKTNGSEVPKRYVLPETPVSEYTRHAITTPQPSVEQIKKKAPTLFLPSIEYITMDEFESVPKYMKGRLSYNQINSSIEDFNKVLEYKYGLLAQPKSKRTEKVKALIRKYKEQDCKDTKGLYFVTGEDLKAHSKLKMDKASHLYLTILRHCGRIKEVRGKGLIRYVACVSN